jgi:hypothetical protein
MMLHDNSVKRLTTTDGRVIAQVVSRWLPTAVARVRVWAEHVGCVEEKVALGQIFSEYFGFPSQSLFRQFLIIITRGWHKRPIGGRSAEWTQLDSIPPPVYQLKKTTTEILFPAEGRILLFAILLTSSRANPAS